MDRRKRTVGLLAVALISILLILPHTRSVLLFQLRLGLIPKYPMDMINPPPVETKAPGDVAQALVIGQRDAANSKSITGYWKMIAGYPNEPALYASFLRYAASYGPLTSYVRPETVPQPHRQWKPYADSAELRMVEQAIGRGKKLDPDNGYFDLVEAVLRFGQKRDPEALAAIHRAAGKRKFHDYTREELQAMLGDSRRRSDPALYWINPTQRMAVSAISADVRFPALSRFRRAAQMANWYIKQDAENDRPREALAIMADLVRVGGAMLDDANWTMDSLLAITIQDMPVRRSYKSLVEPIRGTTYSKTKTLDLPLPNLLAALESKFPDTLSAAEWQALRNEIERSTDFRTRAILFLKSTDLYSHMRLLLVNMALLVTAANCLVLSLVFGILWLLSSTWLSRRRPGTTPSGPGRLSIWLLALLPPGVALVFTQLYDLFNAWSSGLDYETMRILAFALKVLMVVLVFIVAMAGIRRMEVGSRFDGFLARLRTGSVFAMQGLLALYLLTMIINIPLTAYVNHDIDRWMTNEVQMIREYHPPAK